MKGQLFVFRICGQVKPFLLVSSISSHQYTKQKHIEFSDFTDHVVLDALCCCIGIKYMGVGCSSFDAGLLGGFRVWGVRRVEGVVR